MTAAVIIPEPLHESVQAHLFQDHLEQGAFLFAQVSHVDEHLTLTVRDAYLIQPEGWQFQMEDYLEMKDTERAGIMKRARNGDFAVVDCHSHPRATDDVWFSASDRHGIEQFAAYAQWKLDSKPYVATVWGLSSIDAVLWHCDFTRPQTVDEIRVVGPSTRVIIPRGSWFGPPRFTQPRRRRDR